MLLLLYNNNTYIGVLEPVHEAGPDLGGADGTGDGLHRRQPLGGRSLRQLDQLTDGVGDWGVQLELDQSEGEVMR